MSCPRILVAGVGNIFLGDDAFGVEVVQRLARRALPETVHVVDFGIRGLDLTYALLEGYEVVILVDAVPRGGPPGMLYVLEPDLAKSNTDTGSDLALETHNMDPVKVLRLVAALGGRIDRLLVVGCEPALGDCEAMQMGLSKAVQVAVEEAVPLIESLVGKILRGAPVASHQVV